MIKAARISKKTSDTSALELARRVLAIEADAVRALIERLDERLIAALELFPGRSGPVAVSGTGAVGLGDALAVALLEKRGFSSDGFARSHPKGRLPRQALLHVADVMRKGADVPAVPCGAPGLQAIAEISRGRIGMTAVVDAARRVQGIFTDGDLRRALEKGVDFATVTVDAVMTRAPRTLSAEALAVEAVQLMEAHKINQLLVVDERGALLGALNMHDLFRAKVI